MGKKSNMIVYSLGEFKSGNVLTMTSRMLLLVAHDIRSRKFVSFNEARYISLGGMADLCSIRQALHIRVAPSSTK